MTFQPVLPPVLLLIVAAAVLGARIFLLRRMVRTRATMWRWCGMTAAVLLLFVAAARPVIEPADPDSRVADRDAPNVFVVLDRSPDMRVGDYPDGASRMSVARQDAVRLIDRYPDARVALISFATRPVLEWPLSADTWSLRPVAATVEPYAPRPDDVSRANAGAAGNMLRYQLIGARQQYPRAKTLVFYLGSGTPGSEQPPRDFNLPDGAVDGGAVFGYGSGPLPGASALRRVADQIGVPFVPRTDAASVVSEAPADAAGSPPGSTASSKAAGRTELYWAPAMLAAVLVLVELYLVLREFRRTRLVHVEVTP